MLVIGTLKYEMAIPIAKSKKKAINIIALSFVILIIFISIFTIILFFIRDKFFLLFSAEKLINYWVLVPLGILFFGLYQIFLQWNYREKDFKTISKSKITQSIGQNIIIISFGFLKLGPIGLILGRVLGQGIGLLTLSKKIIKLNKHFIHVIDFKEIKILAKRYIKFPIFTTSSQTLNSAAAQLPVFFMAILFDQQVIGYYGLANSIVNLPMTLIGASVAEVFYSEVAKYGKENPERIKKLSAKLFKKLFLIGLIPLIILLLFGPFLFSFVFGEKWLQAGVYARIISFLVFTRLIFTPISRVFSVIERQSLALILNIFSTTLVVISFYLVKLLELNSYWAIGFYTFSMSIVYFTTYLLAQKVMSDEIKNKNKHLNKNSGACSKQIST